MLSIPCVKAQQPEAGNITCTPAEKEKITRTLDLYAEGNRKADGKILMKAFAETATVSSSNNGKLSSVSIQDFCARIDSLDPRPANYTLTACNVEKDIAMVRIELEFGDMKFTDMFTLVKDGDEWKIVSKVSHRQF